MTNRISIGIDRTEVEALADSLARDVDRVAEAATASAHETATWLSETVRDDLAAETGLASELFLRRVKRYVRTGVDARGRVFVGLYRPAASEALLGALTQTAEGAKGGRYSFPGAFVATMPGGFRGIFRRTGVFGRRGNPRLERIDVERVALPSAEALASRYALRAEVYFRKAFDRRVAAIA